MYKVEQQMDVSLKSINKKIILNNHIIHEIKEQAYKKYEKLFPSSIMRRVLRSFLKVTSINAL